MSASTERRRQPTQKQLEQQVTKFNARFPVGSPVDYRAHPVALPTHTNVSEPAFILGGHTACAFVKHVRGAVAINALSAPVVTRLTEVPVHER